jgi:cytochrome b pre-mRNA-processing protein 3
MRRVAAGRWVRKLFGGPVRDPLAPLYDAIVAAARRPAWYADGGVPDTVDGRFDMVAAVLSLVLLRLEREGDRARAQSARLTELFIDDMDGQLRQAGIGDIVVGKHVGKLMGALGGRLGAFREAFATGPALDPVIVRNIYREQAPGPAAMAVTRDRLIALRAALEAASADRILEGHWPA